MKLNKKLCTTVVALTLGMQGIAHADSIAVGQLDITNFQWIINGDGQLSNITTNDPHVVINPAGINFGNISANLGGTIDATGSASPVLSPSGGAIPFDSVCVGDGCAGAPTGAPPVSTQVYASYSLGGSLLALDTNGDGIADVTGGANALTYAESSLITNETLANGLSNLGTNTAFDFIFDGVGDVATTLQFDYDALAIASIIDPFGTTDTATASIAWNMTVTDLTTGAIVLSWNPTQINQSVGVGAGDPDAIYASVGSLSQGLLLVGGHEYRVAIGHQLITNATRDVPEPGILALMGIGLLGFIGLSRRNRRIA